GALVREGQWGPEGARGGQRGRCADGACMSRMTPFVVIVAVILGGASHAAPLPSINTVVTMDGDFFGCWDLADLARVVNLDWVKNDKKASSAYGRERCIVLHKGEQFKVQDASVLQGAVCLSRASSSDCYWTNAQMLKTP